MAKVFSVFSSLGGSTIGYKRAGCDVIGGCEIDPKFAEFYYKKNKPQYMVCDDARILLDQDFPFLYDLDILDGSPPCTLFSAANLMADKYKGVKRKFKEGQKAQILDDLVLVFAKIIAKYRPKYFVMENVPGLLFEKNKKYLIDFYKLLPDYSIESGLLNSADLGLPQSRLRAFFMGKLNGGFVRSILDFKPKKHIPYGEIEDKEDYKEANKDTILFKMWLKAKEGKCLGDHDKGESYFTITKLSPQKVTPTIIVKPSLLHYQFFRYLNEKETCRAFGLPDDFMVGGGVHFHKLGYIVPPIFYEKIVPRLLNW